MLKDDESNDGHNTASITTKQLATHILRSTRLVSESRVAHHVQGVQKY